MSSDDYYRMKVLEAQENVDAARKKLFDAHEAFKNASLKLLDVAENDPLFKKHTSLVKIFEKDVDACERNLQGFEKDFDMWVKERDRLSANPQQSKDASSTPSKTKSTSPSTGSGALHEVVTRSIAPSISISINGIDISTNDNVDELKRLCNRDPMDVSEITTDARDEMAAENLAKSMIDALQISETACQIMLSKEAKKFDAIDTSAKTSHQFKDSKSHDDGVRFNLSANSDLVFTFCPGVHVIKQGGSSERLDENDYAVLSQALLRVYTVCNCHAYYNTAWATACTNSSAWFVLFRRNIDMFDGKIKNADYERITVRRISHDMIYKIWMSYKMRSSDSPNWFYTHHAPYLLRSISCICDPHTTITRLVAKSMAYVYAVSFPQRKDREVYACPQPDIAVKVIENKEDFAHEKAALAQIVPAYNEFNSKNGCEGDLHYALGYFCDNDATTDPANSAASSSDDVATSEVEISLGVLYLSEERTWDYVCKQHEHATAFLTSLNEHKEFKRFVKRPDVIEADMPNSLHITFDNVNHGGVIIMRWGAPIRGIDVDKIIAGVLKSLRVAHSVKWYHCDVRKPNFMLFKGKFVQLIDYGMARQHDESSILEEGGRWTKSGWFIKQFHKIGQKVIWTAHDDFDMFAVTMRELLQPKW